MWGDDVKTSIALLLSPRAKSPIDLEIAEKISCLFLARINSQASPKFLQTRFHLETACAFLGYAETCVTKDTFHMTLRVRMPEKMLKSQQLADTLFRLQSNWNNVVTHASGEYFGERI